MLLRMELSISLLSILAQFAPQVESAAHSTAGGAQVGFTSYGGIIILGFFMLLSFLVQSRMKHHMEKFSQQPAPMTGAQAAQQMLAENGIHDVKIISTPGRLTDHYNPLDRTVNLSEMVYSQASVAAMAVAAHECGHAIQHAKGYAWLQLRSTLVPMVGIGSNLGSIVLMIGLFLLMAGSSPTVAWIGLSLFGLTTLFAFVTLPVEFDASRRALQWLDRTGALNRTMQSDASTALRWAAMTYVVAALSSLAMLAYYAMMILGRSRD